MSKVQKKVQAGQQVAARASIPAGTTFSMKGLATAAVAALLLTVLAYSNSFNAAFHFDDFHQVVTNPNIRHLSEIPRFFTDSSLGSSYVGVRIYRPVTFSTFAVNFALSGYDVFGYHVLNLLLHILNALLVYLIVISVPDPALDKRRHIVALAASALFALHPVETGTVTYITGRAVLLASFFCLTGLFSHMRFRAAGSLKGRLAWAGATLLSFALGLLSKEMAVGLIGLLAAYDLVFVTPGMDRKRAARALAYYIPVLAAAGLYLLRRLAVQGFATVADTRHSTGMYLMSEAKALLVYLRLMVFPANLNADYSVPYTTAPDAGVFLGVAVLALMVYLLFRIRKSNPAAAFFGLWFLVALTPESSLIPRAEVIVEYRLYLPSAGFIACIAALLMVRPLALKYQAAVAVVILSVLGVLTFGRNAVWATELTLWSDVVKKSPGSVRAHANLSQALMDSKQYQEAIQELRLGLDAKDNLTRGTVLNDLGLCYENVGLTGQAIESYRKAIEADPKISEASENLGSIYMRAGRFGEAAAVLDKAVKIDPGYTWTHYNLAEVYTRLGRDRDALREMEAALDSSPKDFLVMYKMAAVCVNNGMKAKATEYARLAVELAADPEQRKNAEALLGSIK